MRCLILVLLLMLPSLSPTAGTAGAPQLQVAVEYYRLPNGLRGRMIRRGCHAREPEF